MYCMRLLNTSSILQSNDATKSIGVYSLRLVFKGQNHDSNIVGVILGPVRFAVGLHKIVPGSVV